MRTLSDKEMADLRADRFLFDSGRVYAMCRGCGKIVRLNKRILGSLHLCS